MKLKKIVLVSIVLLAILTIGAVSAEDGLAADDDVGDVLNAPVDEIDDDDEGDDDWEDSDYDPDEEDEPEITGTEPVNITFEFPDEIVAGKQYEIPITFDKNVSGEISASSESCSFSTDVFGENFATVSFMTLDMGSQTYEISYSGDDTYAPKSITGEFTVTKYAITYEAEPLIYGETTKFTFNAPNFMYNPISLIVNGREYSVYRCEEEFDLGEYECSVSDLKYGDNTIRVMYPSEYYGDFNETSYITVCGSIVFTGTDIHLILPSDATGTLSVYLFDENDGKVFFANETMKNGCASVSLESLSLGEISMYAEYIGDENYDIAPFNQTVTISPRVTIPPIIYPNRDAYAEMNVPGNLSGTFALYVIVWDEDSDDYITLCSMTKVDNGYGKILLKNFDAGYHSVKATFIDGEGIYAVGDELGFFVIDVSPNRLIVGIDDGDTIVKYDELYARLPEELNGTAKIFYDGEFLIDMDEYEFYFDLPYLTVGNHTISLKYSGVDCNFTRNISFNVASCVIDIPEVVDVGYDSISVELAENVTGVVEVYVDGKLLTREEISEDYYVDGDTIPFGVHEIKITFTDNATKVSTSESNYVQITYSIEISEIEDPFVYGGDDYIEIYVPSDISGDVIVTIDGKKHKWTSDGYQIQVYLSDLDIGGHEMIVEIVGDKKYPDLSNTCYIQVEGSIDIPYLVSDPISLVLPSNAEGNLILDIYKILGYDEGTEEEITEFIRTEEIPLVKGKATYDISSLHFGKYYIEASYDGDDYWVEEKSGDFNLAIQFDHDGESHINKTSTFTLTTPISEGIIKVNISEVTEDENGSEILTLIDSFVLKGDNFNFTPQKFASYEINVNYVVDGETVDYDYFFIDPVPDEINFPMEVVYNNTSTISMRLPEDATGCLTAIIYIENDVESNKTVNRTFKADMVGGIASIDLPGDLDIGTYLVDLRYDGNKGNFTCEKYMYVVPYLYAPDRILSGEGGSAMFEFAGGISEIQVVIAGKETTVPVIDGKAKIDLPEYMAAGRSNEIVVRYTDKDGSVCSISKSIMVKKQVNMTVVVGSATVSSDLIFKVSLSDRLAPGNVTVTINGINKTADIESGYAIVNFGKLAYGDYNATVTYNGNNAVSPTSSNVTANVTYDPAIKAANSKVYYNEGKYSITLKGFDGKIAVKTDVVFKINGKFFKKVKTNSKGVATIKLTKAQVPKTYKVTVTALGKTVNKKITVKQVLTLKTVKIKKSARKLVLTATLKSKKPIRGKLITFKFNGKTYKAKTNKRGVAKVTVKKSDLNKLKVGKKVKYQATYLKDTVKKSAKVKK